ncbi:MAG: amidohydrolase family protein [Planctomycetes bacterium]|nr:amidohydrolase family protein [Planctomycetota bacterium]
MNRSLAVWATLLAVPALAQDLLPKAAPQTQPIVLQNGTIHTVANGTILGGSLWFDRGRIVEVLPADREPTLPADRPARVIDLQGRHVYPGLVSACSNLGLQEIGMVKQTVDTDELGELSPEALAIVAVNPDTTAIPVARRNGVLTACVFPSGGLLPGRSSVIALDGWTNEDLAVLRDAGVVVGWPAQQDELGARGRRQRGRPPAPPGNPGAPAAGAEGDEDPTHRQRQRIDQAFVDARAWLDQAAAEPSTSIDLRWQALAPALRREAPVFLLADEREQIESAVLWAVRRGLRAVIVGGRDALACAALLRQHDVPVIVMGTHKLPHRDDAGYAEPFELPGVLARADVRFCIATGDNFSNERNLPYHAATAAAFGLDPQRALRAITLDAATIVGVGARLGSLEVGKDATLFIADGDPLELPTRIEAAFLGGRELDLRSKQTELAAKYRARHGQTGR